MMSIRAGIRRYDVYYMYNYPYSEYQVYDCSSQYILSRHGLAQRTSFSVVDNQQHLHHRRDRLKQLRAFCHAARLGSISRAAEQVMSSQPAVSLQVRTLEEELGVLLFERRGPRIALTRVGESLYQLAMPLVEGMDRLPDTFAEQYHGVVSDVLRIGAGQTSASYLLPRYLKRFREQYPGIQIEVRTGTGQQRLAWLRAYELDLIVAAMDIPPSDVEFHPIFDSDPVLITSVDHPLAGRDSLAIEEVAPYPFVGHASTQYVRQVAEVVLRLHGVAPDVVVEVDGWSVITNYVAAGIGISFVPDLCLTEHDPLWKISLKSYIPQRRYGAITRRDRLMTLAASRFLRIMASDLPEASGEL